jgi:hypothetical protein
MWVQLLAVAAVAAAAQVAITRAMLVIFFGHLAVAAVAEEVAMPQILLAVRQDILRVMFALHRVALVHILVQAVAAPVDKLTQLFMVVLAAQGEAGVQQDQQEQIILALHINIVPLLLVVVAEKLLAVLVHILHGQELVLDMGVLANVNLCYS